MDMIKVKQIVKIQRADGRVIRTMVTAINQADKCVTVSFFELGDVWSMEVELDAILSLNPDLTGDAVEQQAIEYHQTVNATLETFLSESNALYNLRNNVDYDQDAYCERLESMSSQLLDIANQWRDKMAEYRAKLAKEEMPSCKLNPNSKP